MADVKNYNYEIQKLFLEMFLANSESYSRCQNIFSHVYFDKSLRQVAKFIKDYTDEYRALPDTRQIKATCQIQI